jgi:hypothetical protein
MLEPTLVVGGCDVVFILATHQYRNMPLPNSFSSSHGLGHHYHGLFIVTRQTHLWVIPLRTISKNG